MKKCCVRVVNSAEKRSSFAIKFCGAVIMRASCIADDARVAAAATSTALTIAAIATQTNGAATSTTAAPHLKLLEPHREL
jgi:hypothetical protein